MGKMSYEFDWGDGRRLIDTISTTQTLNTEIGYGRWTSSSSEYVQILCLTQFHRTPVSHSNAWQAKHMCRNLLHFSFTLSINCMQFIHILIQTAYRLPMILLSFRKYPWNQFKNITNEMHRPKTDRHSFESFLIIFNNLWKSKCLNSAGLLKRRYKFDAIICSLQTR